MIAVNISSIRQEVLRLRRVYKESCGLSKRDINNGRCDDFANDLLALFPDGDTYWGEDYPELFRPHFTPKQMEEQFWGHCFFGIEGMYFDSECPNGVNNPALLPFFQRQAKRLGIKMR